MNTVGVTPDNRPVVSGVFELVDTYGVPLELILSELSNKGIVVAWDVFIREATTAGWSNKNTDSRIEAACADVYGPRHAAEVMSRVAKLRSK